MTADGAAGAAVPGAGMSADATAGGAQNRTADIVAGPGGVMTDEVGVVTGELTLRTEYADGQVTLRVQYKDADEWYAVTGGGARWPTRPAWTRCTASRSPSQPPRGLSPAPSDRAPSRRREALRRGPSSTPRR